MVNDIKYNCIFGGGGVRGLAYIGAVKALNEHNIKIDSIAGSSVGAVFASLYAVGYNYDEIKEMFLNFNFNMFMDLNINLFNNDISISKGEIFLDWIREKLEKKIFGNSKKGKKVCFKDIERDLQILALDINTNTPFIFSKATTPDEEIALAVRVSAGLPGLMKPINFGDSMLVDGDLIKSWPALKIFKSLNSPDKRILEFRLEGSRDGSEVRNPFDYLNSIISTIWSLSTEQIFDTYNLNDRYDFVVVDTKDVILFDFTIDKAVREKLIDIGYKQTVLYFSNTLVNKKQELLKIYNKIYNNVLNLKKIIITKSPDEALNSINNILSTMCEDTKYIDVSIYEKLKEFKELLSDNIKNDFIICKNFTNYKRIKDRCDFIIMLLEQRITDIKEYINIYCNKC